MQTTKRTFERAMALAALSGLKVALGPAFLATSRRWPSRQNWVMAAVGEMLLDKVGIFPPRYRLPLLIPHTLTGAWVAQESARADGEDDPWIAVAGGMVAASVAIAAPIVRMAGSKILGVPDALLGLGEDYLALQCGIAGSRHAHGPGDRSGQGDVRRCERTDTPGAGVDRRQSLIGRFVARRIRMILTGRSRPSTAPRVSRLHGPRRLWKVNHGNGKDRGVPQESRASLPSSRIARNLPHDGADSRKASRNGLMARSPRWRTAPRVRSRNRGPQGHARPARVARGR